MKRWCSELSPTLSFKRDTDARSWGRLARQGEECGKVLEWYVLSYQAADPAVSTVPQSSSGNVRWKKGTRDPRKGDDDGGKEETMEERTRQWRKGGDKGGKEETMEERRRQWRNGGDKGGDNGGKEETMEERRRRWTKGRDDGRKDEMTEERR
ncbi:hypothetical protein NHX12_030560 [Muraenolepis orangiensis]|uniref:Uncharacterized protein n=1 Tax=Muraenolepis orangiensis TaxID=630683 RepID=A0A9Q0E7Z0_9TELE|nr:hypothetical protein NHX12_030560 [Muraenolepis orangiensis]